MSLLVYYVDDGGGANDAEVKLECTVMLQKEQPEGLIDAECGTLVAKGYAGLCKYVGEGRREEGGGAARGGGRGGERRGGEVGGGGREGGRLNTLFHNTEPITRSIWLTRSTRTSWIQSLSMRRTR